MAKITTQKVLNLAKKLGLSLTFSDRNLYGGYDQLEFMSGVLTIINGKVYIITTCGNCGQGNWVDVTNLIK